MAASNTQRTLAALKKLGYKAGVVERFNPHVGPHGIRQDLYGFIDIIALDVIRKRVIAVQSCGQSRAAHEQKILNTPEALMWLQCGQPIELWSWAKRRQKLGGKLMVWKPRVDSITIDMFEETLEEMELKRADEARNR